MRVATTAPNWSRAVLSRSVYDEYTVAIDLVSQQEKALVFIAGGSIFVEVRKDWEVRFLDFPSHHVLSLSLLATPNNSPVDHDSHRVAVLRSQSEAANTAHSRLHVPGWAH
ncbi:hypothetical protein VDGL01_02279 [Verticillium dahliae]